MDIIFKKKENLRRAIFDAGYEYAKRCFADSENDEDAPRIEDGRVNPHYHDLEDAAAEILGWGDCPLDLDKELFPDYKKGETFWPYIDELLEDEDVWVIFSLGQRTFIDHAYGTDWEEKYPDLRNSD